MAYRHEVDPNFLKGKNVLELGSGTGLVGLAVGLLERTVRVEVTDQAYV
jgi:predicted nicotinamide N-methyase